MTSQLLLRTANDYCKQYYSVLQSATGYCTVLLRTKPGMQNAMQLQHSCLMASNLWDAKRNVTTALMFDSFLRVATHVLSSTVRGATAGM